MSGHTPGPWEAYVRVARDGGSYTIAVHEQGYPEKRTPVVAWPGFDDSRRPIAEHAANARLIAAAPELLEALEAARHVIVARPDILDQVDAAIAKARGGGA